MLLVFEIQGLVCEVGARKVDIIPIIIELVRLIRAKASLEVLVFGPKRAGRADAIFSSILMEFSHTNAPFEVLVLVKWVVLFSNRLQTKFGLKI